VFVLVGGILGSEDLVNSNSIRVVVISATYDAVLAPLVFLLVGWALHEPRTAGHVRGGRWGA
jgi:hypothetical protein